MCHAKSQRSTAAEEEIAIHEGFYECLTGFTDSEAKHQTYWKITRHLLQLLKTRISRWSFVIRWAEPWQHCMVS